MHPVKISIVIPVYNGANYVCQAVDSALQQFTRALEVVVRDNASTDSTVSLLQPYCGAATFRLIAGSELLPTLHSWDAAVRATAGDWFLILGHDDRLDADLITRATAIVQANPSVEWIINIHRVIDSEGRPLAASRRHAPTRALSGPVSSGAFLDVMTKRGMFFTPSGVVVKRSLYDRLGGFDLRYPYAGDWDFYLRAGMEGKVYVQPDPILDYRIHPQQGSCNFILKDHGDTNIFFEKLATLGHKLTTRQLQQVIEQMSAHLRRTISHQMSRTNASHSEILMQRSRVSETLNRWQQSDLPGAPYVKTRPSSLFQAVAWYCARYAWTTEMLRKLLLLRTQWQR
jgi:glycosyltransferase involved in cell wall biosynthesis